MIIHLTSDQLRKIADQLDAYSALEEAGAEHQRPNTVVVVDDVKVAYLHWWQDREIYMAEFISFRPGDATPLYYHEDATRADQS